MGNQMPVDNAHPVPELGLTLALPDSTVNYHDVGAGPPVLLVHGSGPGVSAWANWRAVLPDLATDFRTIAPDMVGFGYTRAENVTFDIDRWVAQLVGILDALELPAAHVIGNSFGGSLALHLAQRHPERVKRLVLMGPVGVSFELTEGLDAVWGYSPSLEAMRHLMGVFAYDRTLVTDDLVESRHRAASRAGVQERYAALFPAPRQRWVDALALPDTALRDVEHDVMVVHGTDDQVIPYVASERLVTLLPHARLEPVPRCGHWVQVEHTSNFCALVRQFLTLPQGAK